jgi:hypothetical protein
VRVQSLELRLLAQRRRDLFRGAPERILALGEQLDQPRPPLEELGELIDSQLPR